MINKVIENETYKDLMKKQIKELVDYLLNQDLEFAITVNINNADFNPELPSSIKSKLSKFSLFILSNYTYTTVKIDNDTISFEAGFGSENFGSTVTIPLESVFQIVIDDSILLINPVATVEKFNEKKASINKSMNIFKNNPNNKKFT